MKHYIIVITLGFASMFANLWLGFSVDSSLFGTMIALSVYLVSIKP